MLSDTGFSNIAPSKASPTPRLPTPHKSLSKAEFMKSQSLYEGFNFDRDAESFITKENVPLFKNPLQPTLIL